MGAAGTPSGEAERPIVNIVGQGIALGPHRRDLLPLYERWINDFSAQRNLGMPRPFTAEQEARWFEGVAGGDEGLHFTIYRLADWLPIGTTGLGGIDYRNRTAEFGLLIGAADCRGQGHGSEAARLVLDYAFTALGLHSVYLRVHEFNLAGRRAYAKAGYREIGRRRQCVFMGGRLWDEIYMDCLAAEFTSPVLSTILVPDTPKERG